MGMIREKIARLCRSDDGGIAVLTALSLPALVLLVGGVLDYSKALNAQAKLQSITDAAMLATMSHKMAKDDAVEPDKLEEIFNKELTLRFNQRLKSLGEMGSVQFSISSDGEGSAKVEAKIKTNFIRIVSVSEISISVESSAVSRVPKLEVVLVLDNSGSMGDYDRIVKLKSSVKNMLTIFKGKSVRPDQIKVGIVPFTHFVKIGNNERSSWWLDINDYFSDASALGRLSNGDVFYKFDEYSDSSGDDTNNPAWISDGSKYYGCYNLYEGRRGWMCRRWSKKEWKGTVGIRTYSDLDISDDGYNLHKIPAVIGYGYYYDGTIIDYDYSDFLAEILPLTDIYTSKAVIDKAVDNMNADGGTYIPAGLMWGWRVLSSNEPYSQGKTYDMARLTGTRKIIIMMTDGYNTSVKYNDGLPIITALKIGDVHQPSADRTLETLCDRVKEKGIDIISITLDLGDDGAEKEIKNVFEKCASLGWYDISNEELSDVFASIAGKLVDLHLSY